MIKAAELLVASNRDPDVLRTGVVRRDLLRHLILAVVQHCRARFALLAPLELRQVAGGANQRGELPIEDFFLFCNPLLGRASRVIVRLCATFVALGQVAHLLVHIDGSSARPVQTWVVVLAIRKFVQTAYFALMLCYLLLGVRLAQRPPPRLPMLPVALGVDILRMVTGALVAFSLAT